MLTNGLDLLVGFTCPLVLLNEHFVVCCLSGHLDVTSEHESVLFSVFSRFEMRSAPVWGTHLQEQLVKLARYIFVLRPMCLLEWMIGGIPQNHLKELWKKLSPADYDDLYEALHPTNEGVLGPLDLKPEGEVAFYNLKYFVVNLDQERFERFLHFVICRPSSSHGLILVSFNCAEGLACTPKACTCTKSLVISICYASLSEFKREFHHVLSSDQSFEMHSI